MNVDNFNDASKYSNAVQEDYQYSNLDGIIYKTLLSSNQTKGKYSCVEISFHSSCEKEIPLHLQTKESVIVCVINGNFLIKHGEEILKERKDSS